ncbi:MAG: hypothetical protein KAJ19_14940 [Gammaproteobacteria bacterium]|nr:hypothetical protein [Gammaproteobacteria bacterium]
MSLTDSRLVSLYKHNNDNGADSHGSNNANVVGGTYVSPGFTGTHFYDHDNVDDIITIPADVSLNFTTGISLGSIVRPDTANFPAFGAVFHKTNNYWLSAGWPTVKRFAMSVYISGTWRTAIANFDAVASIKYVVIGTYNQTHVKLFIDGVLRGIAAHTGAFSAANAAVGLGNLNNGTNRTDAGLDGSFIYNAAITDGGVTTLDVAAGGEIAEIQALYDAGKELDGTLAALGRRRRMLIGEN